MGNHIIDGQRDDAIIMAKPEILQDDRTEVLDDFGRSFK